MAYRENASFFAVAHALGVHHQTVQRCVERAVAYGPMAALDDRPRSGKEPTITAEVPDNASPRHNKCRVNLVHEIDTLASIGWHMARAWGLV